MEEDVLKAIAAQLRQPHGDFAKQVGEKMNEGNQLINAYTIESLDLLENHQVLEIGMGNGFFIRKLFEKESTIQYTGCDFSEAMLEEAKALNQEFIRKGKVNFEFANAENLPFKDASFHTVFTVNTIYFWEKPDVVLKAIYRTLKPNGTLTISIRPESVMQHYPFVRFGFKMYSKEGLSNLLTSNNFKVIDIIERDEPFQEVNTQSMLVKTLIVKGHKC